MSRVERAKQFAPFDALKGLSEALRLKEYEHEKIMRDEMSEDQIKVVLSTLSALKSGDIAEVEYFCDGYYKIESGPIKLNFDENIIQINNKKIQLEDIHNIEKRS